MPAELMVTRTLTIPCRADPRLPIARPVSRTRFTDAMSLLWAIRLRRLAEVPD